MLLVLAGGVGLAIHRLRRSEDQLELTRYVERELPPLLADEGAIADRLSRLMQGKTIPAPDARKQLVDEINPRIVSLRHRAEALQPTLNFLVNSDFDRALAKAKAGTPAGPFGGVPFLVKDLEDLHGATDKGLFGFVALGQLGKPIERVAEDAVADFDRWWQTGAATEEHLADQLALPLSLAPGVSRWTTSTASEHLHTVLWTVRHFLPIEHRIEERGRHVLVTLKGAPPR